MSVAQKTFDEIVKTAMQYEGFTFVKAECDRAEDSHKLTFTKNDHEAFVVSSNREIEMNNSENPMIALCQARINNAILTWKNNV